jgi:hypothetical protein
MATWNAYAVAIPGIDGPSQAPNPAAAVQFAGSASTPPTITCPTVSPIGLSATITVNVTSPLGAANLRRVVIEATFANKVLQEIVYDGAFGDEYQGGSNVMGSITNGNSYTFVRDTNWIDTSVSISVYAIDKSGNEAVSTFAFMATAVTLSITSPTVGPLASNAAITVDVVDTGGGTGAFKEVLIEASFPNKTIQEVVYDGAFGVQFQSGTNATSSITNGRRHVFLRDTGWIDTATNITVHAIDKFGNRTTATFNFVSTATAPSPKIVSVVTTDPITLTVTFDSPMANNAELVDLKNYRVKATGGGANTDLNVQSVTVASSTSVVLTVAEMKTGGTYELRTTNLTNTLGVELQGHVLAFVGAGLAPVISLISPPNGSTTVARGIVIVIDITDVHSGVSLSSIGITINAVPAVTGGALQPGFLGTASSIVPITNGHRVSIDPSPDLGYAEAVALNVAATDLAGNAA